MNDLTTIKPIGTIEAELAACRQVWEEAVLANGKHMLAWCCHHEIHFEPLTEPAKSRIDYILSDKPEREQAARFRNFRPARNLPPGLVALAAARDKAWSAYREADAAWREAEAACDKAWAAYREAEAAYYEARAACDKAWAACREAAAAYREAEAAYREAAAAYREAEAAIPEAELKRLHDADWPDNTWDEDPYVVDIFGSSFVRR